MAGAGPFSLRATLLVRAQRYSRLETAKVRRACKGAASRGGSMALLELNGIAKHFGAIEALKGVDMSLESGEVVGLMGDNGAGKSTLVKIIAGNFPPSEGEIRMGGDIKHFHKPVDARAEGIEVVYQDLALCNNLTAAANVFLGREVKRRLGPFRLLDYPAMYARAAELFKELKSETRPRDLVKQMSGGQRQAVAIARTRLSDAKIVLMDEPTAAISVRQVAEVLDLIRRLKDQGIAVVLISHRMPDVFAVSDRVIVMRRGAKVADKAVARTSPEEVTGLITGAIRTA
jgi:simple sugar transport system ATP-binding protein